MSYEKINFKNREVEKPLTFKKHVNDDGTITLEPKPGTIVEEGTPLLADHFNHMDDGIYKAHEEIDNLKLSGIERNKELVANLNSKKISATTNDSLKTNIAKVKDIKLGSGNAVTTDVLQGKTFSSSSGTDLTGTMPNNGILSKIITTQGGSQKLSKGYYEGGEVKAQFNNLVPENVKKGVNIGGTIGTHDIYASHDTLAKSIDISEAYKGLPGVIYFGGSNYISSGSWHTLSKKIKIDAKAEIIPVRFGIECFAESGAHSTKHFNAQLLDESGSIIASVNNNVNSAYSGTAVMSSTVKLIPGMTYTARVKNENQYDKCRFVPFVMFSFNNEAESFVSVF